MRRKAAEGEAGGMMLARERAWMREGKKRRKASARLGKWRERKAWGAGRKRQMEFDERQTGRELKEDRRPERERLRRGGGWGTRARPRGWRKPGAAARGLRAPTGQARLRLRPVPAMGRQEQAGEEEHMQALMEQEEK